MESMKALAKNGRLVISVIHQPRSSIYEMFDRLLLLSCGRVMFLGKFIQDIVAELLLVSRSCFCASAQYDITYYHDDSTAFLHD